MDEDNIFERTIYHKDYNIDKKDNINTFPTDPAVFGFFAILHEKPVHCRYVGQTENLREAIRDCFEKAGEISEGFAKFMQGPWVKMLAYEPLPNVSEEDRKKTLEEWEKKFKPRCDQQGKYPRKG